MPARRIVLGVLLLASATLFPTTGARALPQSARALDGADALIAAVNDLRSAHGLPAYAVSSILMGTAQGQADYMASTGSVTHNGPGGVSVTQRLLAAGYPLAGDISLGGFRSENIVGSPGMSAADAVSAWTGDAPHLNTMLSPNLTEIGAGVAEAGGVTYYVIDAARPTTSGVPQAYTPGAEAALNGGEEIIIPVAISTPNKNGDMVHEVQAGQSLWAIAISYGVKIKDIQQLNNLGQTTVIQRGVKLLVKRVGTPTPAPPTPSPTQALDTPTPFPTPLVASPTPALSPTPAPPVVAGGLGPGAAVGGIAVIALIAAAIVAWAGRSKPT